MGLSREREMGTMEQVLVTPIRPLWLLLGKMLPFLVIGFFDVLLLIAVGSWVFEVPVRGNLLVVAAGRAALPLLHAGGRAADLHASRRTSSRPSWAASSS